MHPKNTAYLNKTFGMKDLDIDLVPLEKLLAISVLWPPLHTISTNHFLGEAKIAVGSLTGTQFFPMCLKLQMICQSDLL